MQDQRLKQASVYGERTECLWHKQPRKVLWRKPVKPVGTGFYVTKIHWDTARVS